MNKIARRILRILGWTVLSIILLLLLVVVLIQVPGVQNFGRRQIVSFLEKKLKTRVEIGRLAITFPKTIVLENIYFEDQRKDTLLAGKRLEVDIAMFALLKNRVEVKDIALEGIRANIYRRGADTAFNFDYIVKAFTTPSTTQPTDTSAGFVIDLDHVRLQKILATFRDDQTGSDMYCYLGDFETNIKRFDLDSMIFAVPDVRLERVVARVYQHKPLVEPKPMAQVEAESNEPINIGLDVGQVSLKDIDADYANDVSALAAKVRLGELRVVPENINLRTLDVHLKDFILNNTDAAITMGNTAQAEVVEQQTEKTVAAQANNPWKFTVNNTELVNNNLKFDNNTNPRASRGMDFSHLDVRSFNLDADNLAFTPTVYEGRLNNLSFSEQSGFNLHRMQTDFHYDEHGVQLNNLLVQTDRTLLRDQIQASWPDLATLPAHMGDLLIRANLPNCTIAFKDVLTFAPTLASMPPFHRNENAVFRLSAQVRGYVKDLEIPNFELSGMQRTAVRISGRITGLPDPARTNFNLNIANLQTSQADLQKLAGPTLPPTIRIPETVGANGYFIGSMNSFNTKLNVATSRGNANIVALIQNMGQAYNVTAGVRNLDLGYIMKQEPTIGRFTGQVAARGSGFDLATMNANVKARVESAQAMGYNYRNLSLNARLHRGTVSADAVMRDPNLSFNLDATAVMRGTYPSIRMDMMLDSVDLQALKLYSSDLRLHGHIMADLPSTNPDALEGQVRIANLVVANAGKRYVATDTVGVDAFAEGGGRHIRVTSEAINADLTGQYKLTELAQAVQNTVNTYYNLPGYRYKAVTPQTWALTASVQPSPLLFTFMPELKGSDSLNARVDFNSAANDLRLAAHSPLVQYMDYRIDSLNVQANTGAALDYAVTLSGLQSKQLQLYQTSLTGNVANNQLTTRLDAKDAEDKSRYQLAALLNQEPYNGIRVSLQPGLMLNYDVWNVTGDNYILYDTRGLVVNNFNITNGTQGIFASSTAPVPTAPIDVRFTDFRISTITELAMQDSLLADGLINGNAQLRNVMADPIFTSDIRVADLSYKRDTVGNLTIQVNNETAQTLAANVRLEGYGNDVRLDGRYFIASKGLDMNLNLATLNLSTIEPFTAGQVRDATGYLRGQMAVTGTVDKPTVNGFVRFDSAYVTPTLLGERFALTNDEIRVNAEGIHFNRFSLADSANNEAVINGSILTSDFKKYGFDLSLTADNFRAVRTGRGRERKPFYGTLNISTNTRIGGDMNLPVVNSYLRFNEGTDFYYILPVNDPEVQDRIGVVQFVDMDNPAANSVFMSRSDSISNKTNIMGIDLDATIETDSAAKFAVVIDERNGDAVHLRGTAALQAGMDKSGKVSLTGSYVMQQGSYLLTLNFLKRQFFVEPGSTITWNGDPTMATVDITAIYVANTSPIDLIEHQLAGRSAAEANQYMQKLPFNVLLKMKGDLLKPQISFDITLPERELSRYKEVDQKLAQIRLDESELNKQVFALLLLNRFVDENPLESNGTPSTAESFVRQSASRILTDQLNRLAGNLVSGVDLTFGLNSGADYSTGSLEQRTDLTVGVSKRLLNDRLRVNVGSSFEVEGPHNSNQQASNIAGDVSVEYQLSKDGRYLIRAYRRNDYEGVVIGQVIETGASFIFTLEYDKFSEFFRKPKNKVTTP